MGDQIADRLAPRSLVFLPVDADAIGLVTGEALRLRMVGNMLLESGGLAHKEHLVLSGPTSAGPSCDDVYGSDRMKIGIYRENIEIMGNVGIA